MAGAAPAGSSPSLGPDIPITGDWDGNGTMTIGVVRPSEFLLRDTNGAGAVNTAASFGLANDVPITGDWDGDSDSTIGVFRDGTWFLRNDNSSGIADVSFAWAQPGDVPITGDWDGDGATTIGVFRDGAWYLRNSNTADGVDVRFGWGAPADVPITGDWDGGGATTIGARRADTWFLRNSNDAGGVDAQFPWGLPTRANSQGRTLAIEGGVAHDVQQRGWPSSRRPGRRWCVGRGGGVSGIRIPRVGLARPHDARGAGPGVPCRRRPGDSLDRRRQRSVGRRRYARRRLRGLDACENCDPGPAGAATPRGRRGRHVPRGVRRRDRHQPVCIGALRRRPVGGCPLFGDHRRVAVRQCRCR